MEKLGCILNVRISTKVYDKIQRIIENDPERFDSESHFVRVAIMKLLREVKP